MITTTEIHFKQPRFFSNTFLQLIIGAVVGLSASIFMIKAEQAKDIPLHWLALAFFIPFLMIIFISRFFFIRKQIKPIIFENEALLLPGGPESFSCKKIPYEHVYSFDVRGKPGKERLIVDTKSKAFAYPLKDFQEPDAAETFGHNLRERIGSLPDGEWLWQRLLTRQALAEILSARKYPVTAVLLGVIAVVYIFQMVSGTEHNPLKLIELGANAPDLVKDGQWYRLITANFLHANLTHVAVNGVALWLLGAMLERLTGSLRFLLIFLVSGLLGALCSTLFISLLFSVGASASVFGLLGALAFINWRFRNELPGGYRIPLHSWLIILGINAALPVFIPQIDIFAHLGGFAGGALAAFMLYGKQASLTGTPLYARHVKALTAVAGSVFLLGSAQVTAYYPDTGKNNLDRINIVKALLKSPDQDEGILNNVAWWLATEPSSSFDALQAARDLAGRAVEIAKSKDARNDVIGYQDTLATAHYRLGDFDKAVEIQRDVLDREQKITFASQLARFLKARVEKDGPVILGNVALSNIKLQKPDDRVEAIVLDLDHPPVRGMDIYAYALDSGDRILGLLRLAIAPNEERKHYVVRIRPDVSKLLTESKKLELALIDAQDCRCSRKGNEWKFWAYDKSISDLP